MRNTIATLAAAFGLCLLATAPVHAEDKDPVEKKEAPAPTLAPGGDLEEQMLGYWAPDPKSIAKKLQEQIGDDPNAAALLPILEAAMANMAVRVKKGEVAMHVAGQARTSTYEVTKKDPATKTLTMKIVDEDGEAAGTARIEGDKLTLAKDGEEIVLKRIKKEEFEKRKAAAQQPLLPPGLE